MRTSQLELPPVALADLPRAHHYGQFYGLAPLPQDDRPLLVVFGNCQAEAIRLLLQGGSDAPCTSVRIPAVHELTREEIPWLHRLLERTSVLLAQPVADGYRDLPLGTAEVSAVATRARTVVWPVIRYAGLLPWQAVFTHPELGNPPVVPYHDVRTALAAAGEPVPEAGAAAFQAVSEWSLTELRRREDRAGAVPVSDLVMAAGAGATNTINHPGNAVLVALAGRLQERLGWPVTAADPGFVLLDSVHAPVAPEVLDALGLDSGADPSGPPTGRQWLVEGRSVAVDEIAEAQTAWYHEHPAALAELLRRTDEQRRLLSLTG